MFQIDGLINQVNCTESYDKSLLSITINTLIEKTKIDPITNCWLWTGENYGSEKYGRLKFLGQYKPTHRLSAHFFLKLDLKSKRKLACHKQECPNKNCWNPNHLYVGNHRSNMKDALAIGTRKPIHKIRGTKKGNCKHGVKDNCNQCRKEYMKIYNKKNYDRFFRPFFGT